MTYFVNNIECREVEYMIPSIEHIKALYNEVEPLLSKLKTKSDIIEFGKKHNVTMEINYDLAELFDETNPIDVIRCESWGDLDYIYIYTNGNNPHFDVWCDFMEYDFINGTTIKELEKNYIEGVKWLWLKSKTRPKDLEEIISILRQHGVQYADMIKVYGFEIEIVEDHKSKHYE